MLEPLCFANDELAEAQHASLPRLIVADEQADGSVLIARCAADGQRLDLLRLSARGHGGEKAVLETIEASLEAASRGTVVTAMAWLPVGLGESLLCVGYSHGGLGLFTPQGVQCLAFLLCPRSVLRIRLGQESAPAGAAGVAQRRRCIVLHSGGAVCSMPLDSLATVAARSRGIEGALAGGSEGEGGPEVPHELYQLKDREETVEAVILEQIHPIEDVFATQGSPGIIAFGTRPFLSQHRISSDGPSVRSLIGGAASAVATFAKGWLPFRGRGEASQGGDESGPPRSPRFPQGQGGGRAKFEELPATARFADPARVGERLEPAPHQRGRLQGVALAATCDAYGRVGLFCLETLRCLHLWKGYREAQVAWLRRPPRSSSEAAAAAAAASGGMEEVRLGLAIYAPRRGLLELWDVGDPSGPSRASAAAVDLDCRLLSYGTMGAYLLRPTGQLDRVRWHKQAAAGQATKAARSATSTGDNDSDTFNSVSSEDEAPDELLANVSVNAEVLSADAGEGMVPAAGGVAVDELAALTGVGDAAPASDGNGAAEAAIFAPPSRAGADSAASAALEVPATAVAPLAETQDEAPASSEAATPAEAAAPVEAPAPLEGTAVSEAAVPAVAESADPAESVEESPAKQAGLVVAEGADAPAERETKSEPKFEEVAAEPGPS